MHVPYLAFRVLVVSVVAGLGLACTQGLPQTVPAPEAVSESRTALYARRHLHEARRLRAEGRPEAAARVCARGLDLEPDNAPLHQLCAEVLTELGRDAEAASHHAQAEGLGPPTLPDSAVEWDTTGVVVIVLASRAWRDEPDFETLPGDARETAIPALVHSLEERLAIRMPGAEVHFALPGESAAESSVAESRAWLEARGARAALSLRIDRVRCGETVKDGRYALARLQTAAARPGRADAVEASVKDVRSNLPEDPDCRTRTLALALENTLEREDLRAVLELDSDDAAIHEGETLDWSRKAVRSLFPGLGERIDETLTEGRRLATTGQLEAASARFRAALAIDPDDVRTLALLQETETTLSLSRELSQLEGHDAGDLAPRLSESQARAMEQRLLDERDRRDLLTAALEAVAADDLPPGQASLVAMQPAEPGSRPGAELARSISVPDDVALYVLYTPEGDPLAYYYFRGAEIERPLANALLVREEDTDRDGAPDRWVVFSDGVRREVHEAGNAERPEVRMIYTADGSVLERVALYAEGQKQPGRIFEYQDGRVRAELRDTNADGRHDRIERFDPEGALEILEEDLDHDDEIDVRTLYRDGRMIRFEVLNPHFDLGADR